MELTQTSSDDCPVPQHPGFTVLRKLAMELVRQGKGKLDEAKQEIEARRIVLQAAGCGLAEAGVMAKAQFLAEHGDDLMQIKSDLLAQCTGQTDELREMIADDPAKAPDRMSRIQNRCVKTLKEFESFLDLATTHPSLDQKAASFVKVDNRKVVIPPKDGGQRLKDIVEAEPAADAE